MDSDREEKSDFKSGTSRNKILCDANNDSEADMEATNELDSDDETGKVIDI